MSQPTDSSTQSQPQQSLIDTGSSGPARPLRFTFADGEHVIPAFMIEFFGGKEKFLETLGAVLSQFTWSAFAANYSNLVTRETMGQLHTSFISDHFRTLGGQY
jgi:hypothetical protein